MIFTKIGKVLTKAYSKEKPIEEEFRKFETALQNLPTALNQKETEEFNKNVVSEFFKNGFGYSSNTKGRIDLAIYKNGIPEVIIEYKNLKNSSEMVTLENFNRKALYEITLYYLREKIKEKNHNIRNLIITNSKDWFVIDAVEFEKITSDKEVEKLYIDFEIEKKLSSRKTEYFYKLVSEIIKRKSLLENLEIVYFDLQEEKLNQKNIYKLLSPPHLLKEFSQEDSNSLNRGFYLELLHIFGLEETSGKKKFIRRKQKRDIGSFLEITILKLQTEFQIFDEDELFRIGLELNITWLNRILFLKLLEAKLLNIHNGDYPKFLSYENTESFGKLNTLFFEVLAFRTEDRRTVNIEIYKNIPYLNSSLFETTELEREYLRISNLNDNLELSKYKGKNQIGTFDYLLNFLNSYNFGDDSSEFKSSDLINSAVLGLIFEKLNGYKDGSFFTPAFITMYMSRETIQKVVVEKFNSRFGWSCKNLDDVFNKDYDISEANEIINSITVIDPAVGSGHFLVSALNELIYIKSCLGILADENGKRLKNIAIEIENDELYILDEDGEHFEYQIGKGGKVADEVTRIQKTLFREKRQIIENQLFGVDINRNSVHIARLRLWIELLKESYYENGKLITLPNIDINIKVGNSLISRYDLEIKLDIGNYQEVVNSYKTGKRDREEIKSLHRNFRSQLKYNLPESIKLRKLLKEYVDRFGLFAEFMPKKDVKNYLKKHNLKDEDLVDLGQGGKLLNIKDSLILQAVRLTNYFAGEYITEMMSDEDLINLTKTAQKNLKPILELEKAIEYIEHGEIYKNSFEWRFEFPEALSKDGKFIGFDVVIGNPPYGVLPTPKEKIYFLKKYKSAKTDKDFKGSVDSYSLFIERGMKISKGSYINFIVPLAITSSDSVSQLHNLIYQNCEKLKISSYSSAPKRIFAEADQRVSIIEMKYNRQPTKEILTTTLNKRYAETTGKELMKNLKHINSFGFQRYGRIPKVGKQKEIDILNKLFSLPKTLKDFYIEDGKPVFYRTSGGRYYNVVTNFSTGSTKENSILVDKKYQNLVGAILSSSLYYWFYSAYSNNLDIKFSDLANFPLDLTKFSDNEISNISKIYEKYMKELESNSYIEGGFKRYIARKSKPLLDKIDFAIYKNFDLNSDEVDFIVNFSKEFRV